MVLPQLPCDTSGGIVQDPLPEAIELHPPIPTPLDRLEAVDMAFDRTGRPRKSQRGVHGGIVPLEPFSAVLQLHTGASPTGLEPGSQVIHLLLADHRRPLADQRCHLPQLFVLLETFPEHLLVRYAMLFSLQEEPRELACGW